MSELVIRPSCGVAVLYVALTIPFYLWAIRKSRKAWVLRITHLRHTLTAYQGRISNEIHIRQEIRDMRPNGLKEAKRDEEKERRKDE